MHEYQGNKLSITPTKLSEVHVGKSIIACFFGPPKTGKTFFSMTGGNRTLLISTLNGVATLKNPDYKKRFPDSNPYIEIVDEDFLFQKAQAFDTICEIIDYYLEKDLADILVVDSATDLNRFSANKGVELNQLSRKSKSKQKMKDLGILTRTQADYLISMDLVEQFVGGTAQIVRDAKKHFILTAHERHTYKEIKDAEGKSSSVLTRVSPGFVGKTFPDHMLSYFDLIWQFGVRGKEEQKKYYINTVGDEVNREGHRWGSLFEIRLDPHNITLSDVIGRISDYEDKLDLEVKEREAKEREAKEREVREVNNNFNSGVSNAEVHA